MAWSFSALLRRFAPLAPLTAVTLILADASPVAAYPTPVDFSGRPQTWPLSVNDPVLTYEFEADTDADLEEFSPVVADATTLWSNVEGSYLRLVESPSEQAKVSLHLRRQIEDSTYSSGYTEFDELDTKGTPVHCSIYIHTDPAYSHLSIAKTILHELGHCLGLGHSLIPKAIMSYRLNANAFELDIDDKAALSRLYPTAANAPQLPLGCAIGVPLPPGTGSHWLVVVTGMLPLLLGARRYRR